ncbi:MAG: lytic transglycosylase domain-containing protein [Alphaproteobacteria bacterium]|nr:lytic transglycosylase domain-containing protein [Alphaproteobacteria bacterium]
MLRIILIICCCILNKCDAKLSDKVKNELIDKYDTWKKAVKKPKNAKAVFDFFYENEKWPLFNESVTIAEKNINKSKIKKKQLKNNDIYKWFRKFPPMTKEGVEAYISCLEIQDKKLATKFIKQTWIFQNLDASYAREFREEYSSYLSIVEDAQRIKNLVEKNNTSSLLVMKEIVNDDKTLYYINNVLKNEINISSNEVPSDPSERYKYIQGLVTNKKYKEAADVLSQYNEGEDKLSLNNKYYEIRRTVAYYMLRSGDPKLAYEVADKCVFKRKNTKDEEKARMQWLLGFICYRFINKINLAKQHFETAYNNSEKAVRISKNAFWLGEVHLSNNDIVSAIDWYKKASQYFHTFYGFLADVRLQNISGQYMSPIGLSLNNSTTPQIPSDIKRTFNDRELVKVLQATKNHDITNKYRKYCYDKLIEEIEDPYEEILLVDLAQSNEELEIVISNLSKKQHYLPNKKSYKKLSKEAINQVKQINSDKCFISFVHSVIRQESAFNEKATSSAGARGLMQLMPATAQDEANKLNIKIKDNDLYKPSINLTLGSNLLYRLLKTYDDNFVEVLYAYNAGPGNLKKYKNSIQNLSGLTTLETIELIPIKETRVYVKSVLRNRFYYDKVFKCKSKNEIITSILNY